MSTVILFEFPSDKTGARSWILDHATILAMEGKAELKFVGTEQAQPGRACVETIALEFRTIDCAYSTLAGWQRDAGLPGPMEMQLLQIEGVTLADPIFP